MNRLKISFNNINYKLFVSLIILGLCPSLYTTLRVFLLGQFPGEWSYSIAGQLSWVNLIYEIMNEAIILPLFYFIGKVKEDRNEFENRMKTGLSLTFIIYMMLSIVIIVFTKQLLLFMATDTTILDASVSYIRIESIANLFGVLVQFLLVGLVVINKSRYLYIFTFVRLILSLLCDMFLVSGLSFSFNLGVNGIGYSNIIVNSILLFAALLMLEKEHIHICSKSKADYTWIKEYGKVGSLSGIESLVRNVAYMVMISRMVNVVSEQGTYWVANNFIWGWLLLPILQLGELIKQEVSIDHKNIEKNTLGYLAITLFIIILWFVTIPLWKPFMIYILGFNDVEKLFELVCVLVGFYVFYAFQNIFDASFYGLGKTQYMLFESVVTNTIYYGIAFILYITNIFNPTLLSIAILFGIGNIFDSIVSLIAYVYMLKKYNYNILKVESSE